ncbi:MAG: TetR/AcrR family transcriptional regulator [Microbacter sp.]
MKTNHTEQKILEAAEAIFLEKGFSSAKTTEIALKANVNHALIHYYYRTKENLFETIFVTRLKSILSFFDDILSLDIPYIDRIKMMINKYFDLFLDHPQMPFFIFNEFFVNKARLDFLKHRIVNLTAPLRAHFEEITQQAIQKGEIRVIHPQDLLMHIFSLNSSVFFNKSMNQSLFDWQKDEYAHYIEQRKNAIIDFVVHGIQAS